jgi:hypothetical protein
VLTESRRRTCESSGAQEDLADGRSRTAVTRLKTIGWTGLGLKTLVEVPRRNGRHVAASRSSRRDEAIL